MWKTASLKQAMEILEGLNYDFIYVNPVAKEMSDVLRYTSRIRDVVKEVLNMFPSPYSMIVDVAITIASRVMKRFSRPRVAVLMDSIFQAVGLDKNEMYVKSLLNLIEYPPSEYENIIVLVTSSESVTRERIGRHD